MHVEAKSMSSNSKLDTVATQVAVLDLPRLVATGDNERVNEHVSTFGNRKSSVGAGIT